MKRRWALALAIIAVVVAVSVVITLRFRDAPSALSVRAVSDGAGGAIVSWQDNEGIHAQHISLSGQCLWGKGGLLVSNIPRVNARPYPGLALFTITVDGTGGAIVTWQDRTTFPGPLDGPPVDVYSQRVSADGELMWGNGVKTGKVEPIEMDSVGVVADGMGGAIFLMDNAYAAARELTFSGNTAEDSGWNVSYWDRDTLDVFGILHDADDSTTAFPASDASNWFLYR